MSVTISGTGILSQITVNSKIGTATSVTISGFNAIGSKAFYTRSNITSITIDPLVTIIGESAFYGCSGLTQIIIPSNVTTIANSAFYGCRSLVTINISSSLANPSKLTVIGNNAFNGCSKLMSFIIPTGVTSISPNMFENCSALNAITISNSVTSIGSSAFTSCIKLASITIPNSITSIANNAFQSCLELTAITIPNSITIISGSVFYGCSKLASVTIPNSITRISANAFQNCVALTAITIPNSVTTIDYSAFYNCSKLALVTISSSVTSIATNTFEKCTALQKITIPSSITSIGASAFTGCTTLASVTFNGNIPTIASDNFTTNTSDIAYYLVDTVNNINIASQSTINTKLSAFTTKTPIYATILTYNTAYNSGNPFTWSEVSFTSTNGGITYSGFTTSLANQVPNYSNLIRVTIGASVTLIGSTTFYLCNLLANVTFNGNIPTIASDNFGSNTSDTAYYVVDTVNNINTGSQDTINTNLSLFTTKTPLYATTLTYNTVYNSGNPFIWSNATFTSNDGGLNYIGFTNVLTGQVPSSSNLISIIIGKSVTNIANNTFSSCVLLTSVTFYGNISTIGEGNFGSTNDTAYYLVDIANNINTDSQESINTKLSAFTNKSLISLTTLTYSPAYNSGISFTWSGVTFTSTNGGLTYGGLTYTITGQVPNFSNLTTANIGYSITSIGDNAFKGCVKLPNIIIPSRITSIGNNTFDGCTSLTSVTFYGNIPITIGQFNFTATNDTAFYVVDTINNINTRSQSFISTYLFPFNTKTPIYVTTLTYSPPYNNGVAFIWSNTSFTSSDGGITYIGKPTGLTGQVPNSANLIGINIGSSIASIGDNSFKSCSKLASVIIPSSVTSIGTSAFDACALLASVTFYGNIPIIAANNFTTNINDTAYYVVDTVNNINTASQTSINTKLSAFTSNVSSTTLNYGPVTNNTSSTSYNRGEPFTWSNATFTSSDGGFTYRGFTTTLTGQVPNSSNLTNVIIGSSVTRIDSNTFSSCNLLATVRFYSNIPRTIGSNNFTANTNDTAYYTVDPANNINIDSPININSQLSAFTTKISSTTLTYNNIYNLGNSFTWSNTTFTSSDAGKTYTGFTNALTGLVPNHSNLTRVNIGPSVTNIGANTFKDCVNLKRLIVPSSVINIDSNAFSIGTGIFYPEFTSDVTFYGNIPAIASNNFTNTNDTAYYFVDTVNNINTGSQSTIKDKLSMFLNIFPLYATTLTYRQAYNSGNSFTWSNVTFTSIDGGLTYRGFTDTLTGQLPNFDNLTSVNIGDSVRVIDNYAFSTCTRLTALTIPSSIIRIDNYAFSSCTGLTALTIPSSVITIGNNAFSSCTGLTAFTIPTSVTSIGNNAFQNCSGLTALTITNSATTSISIGTSAFIGCSKLTTVTIPTSVTSIGNNAFQNCSGLTALTIGKSITNIGDYVFDGCSLLTSVIFNGNIPTIAPTNFGINNDTANYVVDPANNINSVTQTAINRLSTFTNKISSTTLTYRTAYNSGVSFTWSNTTFTSINGGLTYTGFTNTLSSQVPNNVNLTGVIIGSSVTSIENNAFKSCTSLTGLIISFSVTSISSSAFQDCSALTTLTIPNSVTTIGTSAFQGCSALTTLTISNLVTIIGTSAFQDCSKLSVLTIPNSVTTIGTSTFQGCSGLKSLTMSNRLTTISDYAFSSCSGLTVLTISDTVLTIGNNAFENCTGLTGLTLSWNAISIGDYAFSNCTALTGVVIIRDFVTSIGNYAFYKTNITTLNIGIAVTSIGSNAFDICNLLTKVIFNGNIPTIAANNFGANINDTVYYVVNIANNINTESPVVIRNQLSAFTNIIPSYPTILSYYPNPPSNQGWGAAFWWSSVIFTDPQRLNYIGYPDLLAGQVPNPNNVLRTITIGSAVTDIADGTFWSSDSTRQVNNQTSVTFLGNIPTIGSTNNFMQNSSDVAYYVVDTVNNINTGTQESINNKLNASGSNTTPAFTKTIPIYVTTISYISPYNIGKSFTWSNVTFSSFDGGFTYRGFTNVLTGQVPNYSNLIGVNIGVSVTTIENYAFNNCSCLTELTIPSSVTTIGGYAFSGCFSLSRLTIPSSVTNIGDYAFDRCNFLTSVTFNGNIPTIASNNFTANETAYYLVDPVNNINIDSQAIINSKLSAFTTKISSTVLTYSTAYNNGEPFTWSNGTFTSTNNGLTYIGFTNTLTGQVHNSSNLIGVSIGPSVTRIENNAFRNSTALTGITIPSSVTNIDSTAFVSCNLLLSVTFNGNIPTIASNNFEINNDTAYYAVDTINNINKGSPVTINTQLTNQFTSKNPINVTILTYNSAYNSGNPFTWSNVTFTSNDGGFTYRGFTNTLTSQVPNYNNLISVFIGSSVTRIDNNAFKNCDKITEISIPDSVTNIGDYAFDGCNLLTSVTFNGNIPSITSSNFGVNNDTAYYFVDTVNNINTDSQNTINNKLVFFTTKTPIYSTILNMTTLTYSSAYNNGNPFRWSNCTFRSVNGGVTYTGFTNILADQVPNFNNLVSFIIGSCVTSIGKNTFQNCTGLTALTIPISVKSIDNNAFQNCTGLTALIIPSSVTTIGDYAFDGCTLLTNITINGNIPTIASNNFRANNDTVNYVFDTVNSINTQSQSIINTKLAAFTNKVSSTILTYNTPYNTGNPFTWSNVTFTSTNGGLTYRGFTNTFIDQVPSSSNLTSIIFGPTVTNIGTGTFNLCNLLTSVTFYGNIPIIEPNNFTATNDTAYYFVDYDNNINTGSLSTINTKLSAFTNKIPIYNTTILTYIPPYNNGVSFIWSNASFTSSDGGTTYISQATTLTGQVLTGLTGQVPNFANLTGINIGSSIASIGDNTFKSCSKLASVIISSSVTSIGTSAFDACALLASVTFYGNIPTIAANNFATNINDTAYYVVDTVNNINTATQTSINTQLSMFKFKTPLYETKFTYSEVYNSGKPFIWSNYTFTSSDGGLNYRGFITILQESSSNATNFGNLTNVIIGASVTRIEANAFSNAGKITQVIIPNSLVYLANSGFYNCVSLKTVYISDATSKILRTNWKSPNTNVDFVPKPNAPAGKVNFVLPQ